MEYKELSELPKLTSFETVIQGATAVFKRSVGTEEVEVKIDANSSVQTAVDEMDEEEVEEDEVCVLLSDIVIIYCDVNMNIHTVTHV